MEVRDVTMLGFVRAAEKYIAKHSLQGTELGELKNIDIKKLKNDLSEQLKVLSVSDDYKKALIEVGEKAFDEYAKENLETRNVIDELGEIFSFDVDEEFSNNEIVETNKDDTIDSLLAAYDVGEQDNNIEITSQYDVASDNANENEDSFVEEISNNVEEVNNDFGLSENDSILTTIANAAAKTDEELAKTFEEVNNDEKIVEEVNAESVIEKDNNEIEDTNKELITDESNNEVSVEEANSEVTTKEENKAETDEIYDIQQEEDMATLSETSDNNEQAHLPLSIELQKIKSKSEMEMPIEVLHETKPVVEERKEEKIEINNEIDNNSVADFIDPIHTRILTNPALDYVIEYENYANGNFYEVENRIIEENEESVETIVTNPGVEEKNYNSKTLSSIISSLDELREKKENRALIEEEYKENDEIYENIMAAYPYLSKDFIRTIFSQKEEIEDSYEENKDYILLHRINFSDVEELHEFAEIMVEHGYEINVDEKKMIVDTFGEIINEDGVILTNILGIANQAKILNGVYEGYCVIDKDTM